MLNIGKKKYRNLQEQVGYNTEEIEKIKDLIDGIVIDDKLVVIDSASGSLSEAQMEVLDGPLAFISYNEKVYLKTSESATELVFKAIDIKAKEIGSAYFNVGGSKVVITIATKVYAVSDDLIITSYSKDQIDSIINNIMALLNGKASLSGATFSGPVDIPTLNGETNPSIKPVYIHPIVINTLNEPRTLNIAIFIFDDNPTPYTWDTLKAKMIALGTSLGVARFPTTGSFYTNSAVHVPNHIYCNGSEIVIAGQSVTAGIVGTEHLENITSSQVSIADGVNKIN